MANDPVNSMRKVHNADRNKHIATMDRSRILLTMSPTGKGKVSSQTQVVPVFPICPVWLDSSCAGSPRLPLKVQCILLIPAASQEPLPAGRRTHPPRFDSRRRGASAQLAFGLPPFMHDCAHLRVTDRNLTRWCLTGFVSTSSSLRILTVVS